MRSLRRRIVPEPLRGKPFRRVQRALNQRRYNWPHRCLLIIGQPKSGTTWLARLIDEVPGYMRWTPESIKIRHDFKPGDLTPPPAGYTIIKTHTPPTDENVDVIHDAGYPYVVTLRDPRDLAVSWAHWVGLTESQTGRGNPTPPQFGNPAEAAKLDIPERISFYIERVLPRMMTWSRGWLAAMEAQKGMVMKYEDLLGDTPHQLRRIIDHYGLDLPESWIDATVTKHAFRKKSGGASFNRKGIAGDWKNHFSDAQREAFKAQAGTYLQELGYAEGADW